MLVGSHGKIVDAENIEHWITWEISARFKLTWYNSLIRPGLTFSPSNRKIYFESDIMSVSMLPASEIKRSKSIMGMIILIV